MINCTQGAWLGLRIENTKNQTLLHIKSISCGQKICLKKSFPHYAYGRRLWELLKHNHRKYSVNLDPRYMVGRIYGTTSCGFMVSEKIFLKVFPHFKSIEAIDSMSMDGRIYVGGHKT